MEPRPTKVSRTRTTTSTIAAALRSRLIGYRLSTVGYSRSARAFANLRFVAVGSRAQFAAMNRAIEVNRLNPVIDRVFSFDEAVDAFRYYQAGQFFGKIVIKHE